MSSASSSGGLLRFRTAVPRAAVVVAALLGAVTFLGAWWLIVALHVVAPIFLPSPATVARAFWTMCADGVAMPNALISIGRVWSAFLLSVLIAVPLGILMSGYRIIGAFLEPLIDFIRYLPVPALVPLAIIWFGVGEETKIFLLWLGTFFQLVLMVAADMKRVPGEYFETAYTLGAKPHETLGTVALPAMLPQLMDSMRISLGWCWTYVIIAEIVASDSGLGFVIWTARRFMKTDQVMAGVIMIGLIGLLTDQCLRLLHRYLFRYQSS